MEKMGRSSYGVKISPTGLHSFTSNLFLSSCANFERMSNLTWGDVVLAKFAMYPVICGPYSGFDSSTIPFLLLPERDRFICAVSEALLSMLRSEIPRRRPGTPRSILLCLLIFRARRMAAITKKFYGKPPLLNFKRKKGGRPGELLSSCSCEFKAAIFASEFLSCFVSSSVDSNLIMLSAPFLIFVSISSCS